MKNFIKLLVMVLILLYAVGFLAASGAGDVVTRLRLYEGFRGEPNGSARVVSSYFLKQLPHDIVFSDVEISKEEKTLKRVFNLSDVKLMTQATMKLEEDREKSHFQVVVLNSRKLLLQLGTVEGKKNRFRVEVLKEDTPPRPLLETDMVLPEEKSTILGFEDSGGKIYFLSFHRLKDQPAPSSPKLGIRTVQKPRLLYATEPQYPEEAKQAKIEGKIVINAETDINGNVVEAVAADGPQILREAAVNAVKQWKYEPFIIDGVKKPVTFTVVVKFRLASKKKKDKPVSLSAEEKPKLVKKVVPTYPEEAAKAGVEGKIVVEATTDKNGNVINAKVIDGNPVLNQAAIDAVKQWKYEPYILKGVKKPVKFTVVLKFNLKKKKAADKK